MPDLTQYSLLAGLDDLDLMVVEEIAGVVVEGRHAKCSGATRLAERGAKRSNVAENEFSTSYIIVTIGKALLAVEFGDGGF